MGAKGEKEGETEREREIMVMAIDRSASVCLHSSRGWDAKVPVPDRCFSLLHGMTTILSLFFDIWMGR